MIDTKAIRERFSAYNFINNETVFPDLFVNEACAKILNLCDHIDELERKLKIAEDALQIYADDKNWMGKIEINGGELSSIIDLIGWRKAAEALNEIRGESMSVEEYEAYKRETDYGRANVCGVCGSELHDK